MDPATLVFAVVVGLSAQGEGKSDSPYLGPGFGGNATALVMFVDFLTQHAVGVGAELSLAGDITGDQSAKAPGGVNDFETAHHDSIVSATVKFRTPAGKAVQFAGVGGVGIARRHTERAGMFHSFNPSVPDTPYAATDSGTVPAVTGGADLSIRVNRRVNIVGSGRLHYLIDDDLQDDGVVQRGVSSLLFRVGAGVAIRF
jgi:hypothetical protein